MDRRFQLRLTEMLKDAEVKPGVFDDVMARLEEFVQPFIVSLNEPEQKAYAQQYVSGLMSNLDRKNVESIAYFHDQDRQGMQKFIGQAPWEHDPLLMELCRQVGVDLGEENGVLVFDPSGHVKKGKESVGVQRQWCGRLGKVDNCQVGVYMGYVTSTEQAIVDVRLYLSEEWATDKERRKKAGVPKEIRFQTRHELSLQMLDKHGALLPHEWVAGDDEMGRSTRFRSALQGRNERYLLAVPSNTLVQEVGATPPTYSGRGPRPKVPFQRADSWCAAQPESAWTTLEIRPGEKGPLAIQMLKVWVRAKTERRRTGPEETLVAIREPQEDGTIKHDYYLSNAAVETSLEEFGRVAKAAHRIEQCFQRAKSEAGLSHYEVRTWKGWHRHQTLSLMATWFLTKEARRGKKMDTSNNRPADSLGHSHALESSPWLRFTKLHPTYQHAPIAASRDRTSLSLEKA